MTALPLRDFTDAERAKLDAIEAAPAAEESLRERVARALWDAECTQPYPWDDGDDLQRADYYRLANAALAVLSGPSSDAERAVERVLALADDLERTADSRRVLALDAEAAGASEEADFLRDRADDERAQADGIRAAVAGD